MNKDIHHIYYLLLLFCFIKQWYIIVTIWILLKNRVKCENLYDEQKNPPPITTIQIVLYLLPKLGLEHHSVSEVVVKQAVHVIASLNNCNPSSLGCSC